MDKYIRSLDRQLKFLSHAQAVQPHPIQGTPEECYIVVPSLPKGVYEYKKGSHSSFYPQVNPKANLHREDLRKLVDAEIAENQENSYYVAYTNYDYGANIPIVSDALKESRHIVFYVKIPNTYIKRETDNFFCIDLTKLNKGFDRFFGRGEAWVHKKSGRRIYGVPKFFVDKSFEKELFAKFYEGWKPDWKDDTVTLLGWYLSPKFRSEHWEQENKILTIPQLAQKLVLNSHINRLKWQIESAGYSTEIFKKRLWDIVNSTPILKTSSEEYKINQYMLNSLPAPIRKANYHLFPADGFIDNYTNNKK